MLGKCEPEVRSNLPHLSCETGEDVTSGYISNSVRELEAVIFSRAG